MTNRLTSVRLTTLPAALSAKQRRLLETLFRFRFMAIDDLAALLAKDRVVLYRRLAVLVNRGYVYKRYQVSYQLQHYPAIYGLTPKGLRYVCTHSQGKRAYLKANQKDASLGQAYIDRHRAMAAVYIALQRHLGQHYTLYTRYELNPADFSMPLPALYLWS